MAGRFEVEDFYFFVRVVSPIAEGILADEQHLDGTADVVALDVVSDPERIVGELLEKTGDEMFLPPTQGAKRVMTSAAMKTR